MERYWTLLIFLAWLPTASAANPDADTFREQGLTEYELGHYAAAAQHFRRAAELGDARSPEILALMYRFGEQLYGGQFRADTSESARWAAIAADRHFRPVASPETAAR